MTTSVQPDDNEKLHMANIIYDDWEIYENIEESDVDFETKTSKRQKMLDKIVRFPKLKVNLYINFTVIFKFFIIFFILKKILNISKIFFNFEKIAQFKRNSEHLQKE